MFQKHRIAAVAAAAATLGVAFLRSALAGAGDAAGAQAVPEKPPINTIAFPTNDMPPMRWQLTARPWQPLAIPKSAYLDALEGACRFSIQHQDARGAIVDPFLHREHQYSTPYFAYAVGALIHAGRAKDLLPAGIRAMDHATEGFSKGVQALPDPHGEFYIAPLTEAIELYEKDAPADKVRLWRERLRTPLALVLRGLTNNWRTYAMKGEWLRVKAGLADRDATRAFIKDSWLNGTQRDRIASDTWNLYQDRQTDPESLAVEAVGRGNLLALVAKGYDGEFQEEMRRMVERGTLVSLLLQDPSGQCPPNGRTDNHVFNDVLYQLAFEVMAERAREKGDHRLAGQYRRAALLSFNSIARWRRTDAPWAGSYFVTKNHFDPAERVGYQQASNYGNYNGAILYHLAEAYHVRKSEIAEQPAPVEIGGYALVTDPKFASVCVNAGGMQMLANLRGDTQVAFDHYWTPLGVARFGRVGWDGRLGPSDGVRDAKTGSGVTFGPTWRENGRWVRLADVPDRYQGEFHLQFSHPLLVRCAIDYKPVPGRQGPAFRHEFVLTPDGVFSTLRSADAQEFGITWPLLENEGTPLKTAFTGHTTSVAFPKGADQQNFLSLHADATVARDEKAVRSPYGWLLPVRMTSPDKENRTFVYPEGKGDPDAEAVRTSFRRTAQGFSSALGRVEGTLYIGRTSAGGNGKSIDLDGDGRDEVAFSEPCGFLIQRSGDRITAMETDRAVTAILHNKRITLAAHTPLRM